jgi:hypothetical protein
MVEFWLYHRRFPNLDRPVTFNEKVEHRKLFDRDSRLPPLADKVIAKEHVARVLGAEWIIPTLWCGQALPPQPERNWPIPYALKGRHGSSMNLFVHSGQDEDWESIERITSKWLSARYGRPTREWLYSQLQPGLLVEPYLGSAASPLPDYKIFVFAGHAHLIQVDQGRGLDHKQWFYDRDWKRQPFEYACPAGPVDLSPPESLDRMLWAAERLAEPFPFVRVDLYEIDARPVFGELTFYPNAGRIGFKPKAVDVELGRLWPMDYQPALIAKSASTIS